MAYYSNANSYATINGGAEDDTIYNSGITHWSVLNGGAGNDSIYNALGNYVTITGGVGNDTIRIKSLNASNNVIQYWEGDGNDYFIDEWDALSPNWTLKIGDGSGTYSSQKSGNDIVVTVGEGKITLANMGSKTVNIEGNYSKIITGTEGADTITISSNYTFVQALGGRDYIYDYWEAPNHSTIDAGDGNDTIQNSGGYLTASGWDPGNYLSINGGAGNDSIQNSGSNVTILGGAGNDYIENQGSNVSINGGAGDDTITIYGTPYSITIEGGTGDDSIINSYSGSDILYKYNEGDGNDTISTFNADDTL